MCKMIQNDSVGHSQAKKETIKFADADSNSTDSHSNDGKASPKPSRTASISKKRVVGHINAKENFPCNQKSNSNKYKNNSEIAELRKLKQSADANFEQQEFHSAIQGYKHILDMLERTQASSHCDVVDSCLQVKLLANISQCLLKLSCFEESLEYSLQVIKIDNAYFKAYYRAGVALKHLNRDDEALEILKRGLDAAKASRDVNSRQMYLELFREIGKACDKSIEEMKEQIQNLCEPNKKVPWRFNKSCLLDRTTILLSLTTVTLTGAACLVRGDLFRSYMILLTAGNAVGSVLISGTTSSMRRAFGFGGLFLFNYLLFIILK